MVNLNALYAELYALVCNMTGELNGDIIHENTPRIDPETGKTILQRMQEDGRAIKLTNGNFHVTKPASCSF